MPTHEIERKPLTRNERRRLKAKAGLFSADFGCSMLFGLVFPVGGYLLGDAVRWLLGLFGLETGRIPGLVGAAAGLAVLLPLLRHLIKDRRRESIHIRKDLADGHAEEITVKNAESIEIEFVTGSSPGMCLDIGHGKLLFVWGQWLHMPKTYGAEDRGDEGYDPAHLNHQADPYGFPNSDFTIRRAPACGDVFGNKVRGEYTAPVRQAVVMKKQLDLPDSEVLEGVLDEVLHRLKAREKERAAAQKPARDR